MQGFLANNQVAMPHMPMMIPIVVVPVQYAIPMQPIQAQAVYQETQPIGQQPTARVTKKSGRKLQNKRLEKNSIEACPVSEQLALSPEISLLEASRNERVMRLALAALADNSHETAHLPFQARHGDETYKSDLLQTQFEDIASMTTRTASYGTTLCSDDATSMARTSSHIDDISTCLDEESLADESHEPALAPQTVSPVDERRIGIDIGGVLTEYRDGRLVEIPGSVDAVRLIVEKFGEGNVFIVSRVTKGGSMHKRSLAWLYGQNGFLQRVGLPSEYPSENVKFVEDISGLNGKGVVAADLGLSFFVDDTGEVLESVFADKAGNSGDLVTRFDGTLFHFANNRGRHRWKNQQRRREMSKQFWSHYRAVSSWSEILEKLCLSAPSSSIQPGEDWMLGRLGHSLANRPQRSTSAPGPHRIEVMIEDDAFFGVIHRLLGNDDENFRFITDETGAKVILNGKGSPHPQAQSFEQEPLTICIRAKTNEMMEKATELVEDLLHDIRLQYAKFDES